MAAARTRFSEAEVQHEVVVQRSRVLYQFGRQVDEGIFERAMAYGQVQVEARYRPQREKSPVKLLKFKI